MPTAVKTIADELREHHERVKTIVARAQREDRDLTEAEATEVEQINATMEKLAAKRTRQDHLAGVLGRMNGHTATLALDPRAHVLGGAGEKSPGQAFVESEGFQAMIAGGLVRGPRSPLVVETPLPGGLEIRNATPWLPPAGGYPAQTQLPAGIPGAPVLLPRPAQLFARRPASDGGFAPYLVNASTGDAAPTAAGAAKPEVVLALTLKQAPYEMIAAWSKIAEQTLEDIPGVQSFIDAWLSGEVLLSLDRQVIIGTGTSPQLIGLVPLAGKTADRAKGATESVADAILAQILLCEAASGLPCTGVALAPDVYGLLSTAKASTAGTYLSGSPITDSPPTLLWGRQMAVSPVLAAGTALVGAFASGGASLSIKGGMRIAVTNSDSDDFQKNLVSVRAEIRAALTPSVPVSFGLVTGLVAA